VFLTSNFCAPKNTTPSQWSYNSIPDYYLKTIQHNSKKFKKSYFLTENSQIKTIKKQLTDISNLIDIVPVEDLICNTDEFKETISVLDTLWPRYRYDTFWFVTFIRSILLGIFINEQKLKNTIHVEADNLIFAESLKSLFELLESGEFAYSNEAPYASALALMAFKDEISGQNFVKHHITLLKKGDQTLNPYVGHFYGHVTDMAFIDLIYRAKKNYRMLPCLPYGPFSENFDKLQCVFDPISYGQFLGGTNQGASAGYTEYRHYVGKEIIENKIKVFFDKKPFIQYNNKLIPIFNLHLHNKKAIQQFL
jgi:hypothetical protein